MPIMSPALAAGQQMARQFKQNKLSELEFTQGQYDDEKNRLNASPHFGPDYSGYSNERDYLNGLNRQGQIAGLRSQLSGKGPLQVNHTYAGTNFAMRPSLSALGSAAGRTPVAMNDESDNSAYFARQHALRRMELENNVLEDAQNERAGVDNAYRVHQRGDIYRDEALRNAATAGDAAASQAKNAYFGTEPIRQDQRFESDALARDKGYYDPAVAAATIKAQGDVTKAGLDRDREKSAALKAYSDLIKTQAGIPTTIQEKDPNSGVNFFGYQWGQKTVEKPNPQYAAGEQAIEDTRRVLGLGDQEQEGQGNELSQDDLAAFAQENGMSLDEAMKLAQQHGYTIR